jgi:hypothetical protein
MRSRSLALAFVIVCIPELAHAQDSLQKTAADLKGRAEKTIAAVDDYSAKPPSTVADADDLRLFRGFVRELRDAMARVVQVAAPLAASADIFNSRFDSTRVTSADLVDLASRGRLNRFIPLVNGAVACCDSLTQAAAPAEHAFAESLAAIWKGFGPAQLEDSISRMTAVYKKFETKLLKGFPGMPWEYVLNFHGDRDGPSPNQIIWAHPSLGFEIDDQAAEGTSQARTVLTIQALGYNRYFFKGINYIGLAAIVTVNATEGRDRWRKGAVVHFGNVASVGATRGDGRWIMFVASDRLGDKLVGALVKLR